jgi:N utilization substance protein B
MHSSARPGDGPLSNPLGVGGMLFRMKERALIAEVELAFADGDKDAAKEAVQALLTLDSKHELGREYELALIGKAPLPVPPGPDERIELEAMRGRIDELAFAETLVRGVMGHKERIDQILGECSTNWRVSRMAMVDRNILRLATFELLELTDIPPRATLNEAIEIGKAYGTADSSAFINGILDKVATRVRAFEGQLAKAHKKP